MSNAITEGKDRELLPDRHGEIVRAPTPATIELKAEVLEASRHKEAGEGEAMRARSSIESRTDLRLAATNEAMRSDPARSANTLVIEQETARRWADLDASDFGRIRSDARRENALEAIAGHMRASQEYGDELKKRSPSLAVAGSTLNAERAKVERESEREAQNRIEGSIHARHNRATMDVEPRTLATAPAVELARQDVEDYRKLDRIDNVLGAALAIGQMTQNTSYRQEVERLSPDAALRAKVLFERNEAATNVIEQEPSVREAMERGDRRAELEARSLSSDRHQTEQRAIAAMPESALLAYSERLRRADTQAERAQLSLAVAALDSQQSGTVNRDDAETKAARQEREEQIKAAANSRAAVIDAAALAALAAVRSRETASVVKQLANSPDTATQQLQDAQQSLKTPPLDGRVTAPNDPDIAAQRARAIKRPVAEDELSQALLTRYIVSHEKRGLLDKGATEFTFRSGEQQGRVAFVDAGKALNTELDDKSTIRAMVEVALAKNWKEITVSGADDFRRNTWLEASLNGMRVNGYESREADKQILAELQERKPTNTITVVEREHKREDPQTADRQRQMDSDGRIRPEKSTLDAKLSEQTAAAGAKLLVHAMSTRLSASFSDDHAGAEHERKQAHRLEDQAYRQLAAVDVERARALVDRERAKIDNDHQLASSVRLDVAKHQGARDAAFAAERKAKHIDGDALTPHEKTVLDTSRAILNEKALGEQFTKAALRELEAKLRGERVYVGEIVDHGKAPYKFDKDNDDSYYVTLKTPAGEQVVWGKGLAEAMQERRAGEQVVLQNIGKRDVLVQERVRDAQGQVIAMRPKESQLNAWKADLLTRISEKARNDFANRSSDRQPAFRVYDAKVPRASVQPAAPTRTPEQQRNSRER
jgi:hypothetical protein